MGKNIKSYAMTPSPFPREREGSLTAKVPNLSFKIWYGLTVHIIQNCLPQSNSSELRKFRAVRPHSLRIPQNSHYSINLLYIMFQPPFQAENPAKFQRITQIPHSSPTQSAHTVREPREIRTFC